jgi:hypothetical protein
MQDAPPKESILLALAKFLQNEVRPQTKDPRMAFRMLVASHLCTAIALELDAEDEHDETELRGLQELLGDATPIPRSRRERSDLLQRLNAALAHKIRREPLQGGDRARIVLHLERSLANRLSVANPRFDQSPSIE